MLLIKTLKIFMVIPFFNIINQNENESQRKQNPLRLMSILQSYANYESGFEQTVTVPVPTPQMIPIPVPMQSSEPMIAMLWWWRFF